MLPVNQAPQLVLLRRVVAASVVDLCTFTIPSTLSGGIAALFPHYALLSGLDLGMAGLHLTVAMVVLVCGILMLAPSWLGCGDVKLAAAIALQNGPKSTPYRVFRR